MKKRFTRILAALALLVFMAPSMVGWGQTVSVNDVLWTEPFAGNASSSTTFSETTSWDDFINPTTFVASDADLLSYTSSKAMASISSTATNMDGVHVWLNKSVDSYIQISGIKLYNTTKVKVSWAQATNGSSTTVYYQFDGTGDFTSLSTCSGPNANFESSELSVANHTTITLKFFHPSNNAKNTRIDNLTLTATEVSGGTPTCATPTFSPAAGTYTQAQNVSISCATEGATIYYTTNGDEPTTNSTTYSGAINVSTNTTIKAMAAKSGYHNSTIVTAVYNFVTIEHAGTEADPYTVADARNAIDANIGVNGVYAKGIVTRNTYFNQTNGYISYYISDDGNNTMELEAYNGLNIGGEPFESQDDIQVGDIVVIYGNLKKHNTTYEFDAENQLVSLERPQSTAHVIAEGTLTHVTISGLWDGDLNDITLGDEVEEDTYVYFTLAAETGYTLDSESVSVLDASNNEVQLTENQGSWSFYMPNSSVTINATATQGSVPPVTGDKYVKVTSATDLTSGQYLIVYEEGAVAFDGSLTTLDAVGNTIEVTLNNSEIAVTNETAAAEFTIDVNAGTIKSASGYYIGADDYNNMLKTSQDSPYVNSININNEGNALLQMTFTEGTVTLKYNSASNQNRFRYYKSGQKAIQLYKKVESHTLTIDGYTDVTEGTNNKGYYLIASPVTVDPATVAGMTEGNFDLYYYDQDASDGLEWRNYEANPFNLVPGKGYLYAKKATTESSTYEFTLTGTPYISEIGTVMGWNLIGNPYATAASLNLPFYRMNSEGSALGTETEGNVNYMEGVFVEITPDPETGDMPVVEFSPVNGKSVAALNLNVSQNRGNVIDNAIIRFDNGRTLSKFQFRKGSTKIYVTEGNKDYAIVRSAAEAEMPVSFRASENGTYTLAVEAENVEMNYLHLIDNLTGMDVDLLQTPSYTFDAKTSDYASRFRLVFKANGTNENNAETFAYFNGTNWTVSNVGDATLQVVDVTGRTVANQMINGNAELNLNQPAGVYVIRLVNGDNVKTQKVVVR